MCFILDVIHTVSAQSLGHGSHPSHPWPDAVVRSSVNEPSDCCELLASCHPAGVIASQSTCTFLSSATEHCRSESDFRFTHACDKPVFIACINFGSHYQEILWVGWEVPETGNIS